MRPDERAERRPEDDLDGDHEAGRSSRSTASYRAIAIGRSASCLGERPRPAPHLREVELAVVRGADRPRERERVAGRHDDAAPDTLDELAVSLSASAAAITGFPAARIP